MTTSPRRRTPGHTISQIIRIIRTIVVNLWQVAAVCSKLLPDIRNCIETYDVNTLVCQI